MQLRQSCMGGFVNGGCKNGSTAYFAVQITSYTTKCWRPTEAPKERVFIRTPALVVLHKYIGCMTALLKFGAPIVKDGYKRAALFTS